MLINFRIDLRAPDHSRHAQKTGHRSAGNSKCLPDRCLLTVAARREFFFTNLQMLIPTLSSPFVGLNQFCSPRIHQWQTNRNLEHLLHVSTRHFKRFAWSQSSSCSKMALNYSMSAPERAQRLRSTSSMLPAFCSVQTPNRP